ncbi:transforming acidic coiled-coil-containing protein 2-like isoform X2 [Pseudoliparis swirei]|uniref:transforming acidic coiled-coil-containing protein 2-like isoform X2 n=1 Tax=Pseudoliparis swirei TaxID=2059687 RepID=UPI0024BDE1F5|nr:transforming acidic coiled-coil-containing protein 2-like isoform X2 [Pseudoliparis swirei]
MSWLSPVSWAKWTWTAVRGAEGEEDEEGQEEASEPREQRGEEEEEERSQGCSSDLEGQFATPEAATPVHDPPTSPGELEDNNNTDVDQEERLIVTAPVWAQDRLLRHNMGQDEPAVLLEVHIQTLEAEQTQNLPEARGSGPVLLPPSLKERAEVAKCTAPSTEPTQVPDPVLVVDPVPDVAPAPAPPQEPDPVRTRKPAVSNAPGPGPAPAQEPDSVLARKPAFSPAPAPAPDPGTGPGPTLAQEPDSVLGSEPAFSPAPAPAPDPGPGPDSVISGEPAVSPAPAPAPDPGPGPTLAQKPDSVLSGEPAFSPAPAPAPDPGPVPTLAQEPDSVLGSEPAASPAPAPGPGPTLAQKPDSVLSGEPAVSPAPAPGPGPAQTQEPDSVLSGDHAVSLALEPPEQKPLAEPGPLCNGLDQTEPAQKTKTSKPRPPPLKVKAPLNQLAQTDEEEELPVPTAIYKFDPDQLDDSFNPFNCGGSKIQNSPPPFGSGSLPRPETLGGSSPVCKASFADPDPDPAEAKSVMLEFGLDGGAVSKPPPRKLGGRKSTSKLAAKRQKAKGSEAPCKPAAEPTEPESVPPPASGPVPPPASEPVPPPASEPVPPPASGPVPPPVSEPVPPPASGPVPPPASELVPPPASGPVPPPASEPVPPPASEPVPPPASGPVPDPLPDSSAPLSLDDIPIPKSGAYNFDPSQWDDPDFNPFGSNSTMSGSPVPPRISHNTSEDPADAFKPLKSTSAEDSSAAAPQPPEKVKDGGRRKVVRPAGGKKVRPIPKKSQEETIKSQEETTNIQEETIKSQKETTKSQEETTNIQEETIKSQKETIKSQKETTKSQEETTNIQKETNKSQEETIKSQEETTKSQEETTKSQKETIKSQKETTKSQEEAITNSCKVQKHEESQSLMLDVCSQEEEEVAHTPEITQRVHHATDEEKLASTGMKVQEERGEPDCLKAPTEKHPIHEDYVMDGPGSTGTAHLEEEEDTCSLKDQLSEMSLNLTSKMASGDVQDAAARGRLSEMDKAGVLSLIRGEIVTKEMEVNEWKRKYEESRTEVLEMRKIVTEYETTVAQMIEDEQQQKSLSGSQSVRQLTSERDAAIADLNSVERSFADLFRRYENMKGVLEGFKKNEEVLKKCAQDYLLRIKQEEQRYQTLKMHAEEKLERANEDIAQVRSKADSESVGLNAGLRKEQMKAESLERAVSQKNQEIEELTKICDELIAKLGTE